MLGKLSMKIIICYFKSAGIFLENRTDISNRIYENGTKLFDPLSPLFHVDFTQLSGRLQAM